MASTFWPAGRMEKLDLGNRQSCTVCAWIPQPTSRAFLKYSRTGLCPLGAGTAFSTLRRVVQNIVITGILATAKALLGGQKGTQSPFTSCPLHWATGTSSREEASETLALNLDFGMQSERHQMWFEVRRNREKTSLPYWLHCSVWTWPRIRKQRWAMRVSCQNYKPKSPLHFLSK